MTSRETTGLLSRGAQPRGWDATGRSDLAYYLLYLALNAPWLAFSLWGGTKASKAWLLARVGLRNDSLPHLGSWKADTGFLHRIVDAVEELRPATVVELGAGASTLVCAAALARNGGGRLVSFDQNGGFVEATRAWLRDEGAAADLRHAPLVRPAPEGWPGAWYALDDVPAAINLLVIDGPPWAVHPHVRGAAEVLFDRLTPGAIVLLDDGARPGERVVAARWRRRWPDIDFVRVPGSTAGTLMGRKRR